MRIAANFFFISVVYKLQRTQNLKMPDIDVYEAVPQLMLLLTEWEKSKNFKQHLEQNRDKRYSALPDDWIKMLKRYSTTRGIENQIAKHEHKIGLLKALLDVIEVKKNLVVKQGIRHEDTQATIYIKSRFE